MTDLALKEDDRVIITWLDHFAFDGRFSPVSVKRPTEAELIEDALTGSIGIVKAITPTFVVLSQNWPENRPVEDGGIVIVKSAIQSITQLQEKEK